MMHWILIIIGTIIITLGVSKEFFKLFKSILKINHILIRYSNLMKILFIFFGLFCIFFGLYLESIN